MRIIGRIVVAVIFAATLGVIIWLLWVVFPRDESLVRDATEMAQRILGEDPGKWAHFVFNYQTLIGGMLAILAALITVVAMIVVDQRQATRHNQLVRLSRQPDALKIERALYPTFRYLRECYKEMRDYKFEGYDPVKEVLPDEYYSSVVDQIPSIKANASAIRQYLHPLRQGDIALLFNGRLTNDLTTLFSAVETMIIEIQDYEAGELNRQNWELADSITDRSTLRMPHNLDAAKVRLEAAQAQMKRLGDIPLLVSRIEKAFDPVFKGFFAVIDLYELRKEIA